MTKEIKTDFIIAGVCVLAVITLGLGIRWCVQVYTKDLHIITPRDSWEKRK